MRRIFSLITAVMLIAIFAADCMAVCAQTESKEAVYADSLNDGEYEITVDSSSSMFRVVKCKLIVSGGKMTALMTMRVRATVCFMREHLKRLLMLTKRSL